MLWKPPTDAAIREILTNPASAGAFVYGRRGPHPQRRPGQARQQRRPMDAWPTIHQDAYPAYMSWEQFLANEARLRDNASTFAQRARGTPRHGPALLAGLVVCGRCGYQMRVAYKPQRRYTCTALAASYGAATCLHIDGASLERAVTDNPHLAEGVNTYRGHLTYRAVAEAQGRPFTPLARALSEAPRKA